ncbi:MAG: rubredoxin [Deltaproteobacteria bacterium]|nr:rubredoxin [Deltaproteobacteria bacterium]
MIKPEDMYQCQTVSCGYIYNPERTDRKAKIPKRTHFKDLQHHWRCPICGASRKMFKSLAAPGSATDTGK